MPADAHKLPSHRGNPTGPEEAILDAVRSLRYGSVEITIHDSRVVQVECRNKIRFRDGETPES